MPLRAMLETDREAIRRLYAQVSALLRALDSEEDVGGALQALGTDVIEVARRIGATPYEESKTRQALHDVRGGALTSLALLAYRHRTRPGSVTARALRTLSADHLKVTRNAVLELDDAQRAADMELRPHPVERLVETLQRVASDRASVQVECSYHGSISMSCMEMGALDRAVLNVVNNAVRHATRDPVRVVLEPAGIDSTDLRAIIVNAAETTHARELAARFPGGLSRLFVERFSTTGSGEGMQVCAELVAAAYGLARAEDAVAGGLVGARLVGEEFVAWLHWPAVV